MIFLGKITTKNRYKCQENKQVYNYVKFILKNVDKPFNMRYNTKVCDYAHCYILKKGDATLANL